MVLVDFFQRPDSDGAKGTKRGDENGDRRDCHEDRQNPFMGKILTELGSVRRRYRFEKGKEDGCMHEQLC
jgi:hypothetical protein